MSNTNGDVLSVVEQALREDPSLSSTELQERAAEIDEDVARLSGRQFHARYALQAKKRIADGAATTSEKRPRKTAKKRTLDTSDPVRAVLREQFEERKAVLDQALDEAFKRSIETDSLARVNKLLASLDDQIREMRKV